MAKDFYGSDAEYFMSRAERLHGSNKKEGVPYAVLPFLYNHRYGFVNNPFQKGGSLFLPVAPNAESWDWHWSLGIPQIKMGMWTSVGRFPEYGDDLAEFDAWVKGNPDIPPGSWDLGQFVIKGDFKQLYRAVGALAEAQRKLDWIFPGRYAEMFSNRRPRTFPSFEALPANIIKLPLAA